MKIRRSQTVLKNSAMRAPDRRPPHGGHNRDWVDVTGARTCRHKSELSLVHGQEQFDSKAEHRRNENSPQPDRAQEQCDAGSQQRTQKHGNAENYAQLQIHDTAPNEYYCRNARTKHVDHLGGSNGSQKGHAEKQNKSGSEHSDVTTAEKAAVDCQKESSGIAGN